MEEDKMWLTQTQMCELYQTSKSNRTIIPAIIGRANEADPTYTTSMIVFGITALGALVVALAMLHIDRKQGYGLQRPNIRG